jgi:hypothetical protein
VEVIWIAEWLDRSFSIASHSSPRRETGAGSGGLFLQHGSPVLDQRQRFFFKPSA